MIIDNTLYMLIHVIIGCYGMYVAYVTACSIPYIEEDCMEMEMEVNPMELKLKTTFTVVFVLYLSIDHIVQHLGGLV